MNKKVFFLFLFLSNLLISIAFFVVSDNQNHSTIAAVTANFREAIQKDLERVTQSVRNELLQGNIRIARNSIAQMVENSFIEDFVIKSPDYGQNDVSFENRSGVYLVDIPVFFKNDGVEWGKITYQVSNRPIEEIRSRLNSALWVNTFILWLSYSVVLIFLFFIFWHSFSSIGVAIVSSFNEAKYESRWWVYAIWGPLLSMIKSISNDYLNTKEKVDELKRQEQLFVIAKQIAHDIKAPVGALQVFSENSANLKSRDKEIVNKVSSRIIKLADDLLDKARKDRTQAAEVSEIQIWIEDVLDEKKALYPDFNFLKDFKNLHKIYFLCNEFAFKSIVSNLINNAIEASVKNKEVTICLRTDVNYLQIEIRDNGVGISEKDLANVVSGKLTTKKRGNAIGVLSSKNIIESWGGRFSINSKLGQGTEVLIILYKQDS